MTNNSPSSANRPAFRLGFAPRTGTDKNGQATIGFPVEIGAVFARKDADKGYVAKFSLIPADLKDGVLLLMPLKPESDLLPHAEGAA
jgi:hypothetical protein